MRSNFQTELEDDMISEHQLNSSNSSFGLEGPAPSYMSEICKNAKGKSERTLRGEIIV